MLKVVLVVAQVISCLLMIVFILLHAGRGGGLSDMFGGASPTTMGGSTVVEKNLDRITVVTAVVVFVTTIALVFVFDKA